MQAELANPAPCATIIIQLCMKFVRTVFDLLRRQLNYIHVISIWDSI